MKSWGAEPKSLVEGDAGLLRGDLSGPVEGQTDAGREEEGDDHGLGSPVTPVPLHLGCQGWCSVSCTPKIFVWEAQGSECGMDIAFCKSDRVYISCIFYFLFAFFS